MPTIRYRSDIDLAFDHRRGVYYKPQNDVARDIFRLLALGHPPEQVAEILADEYDAPASEILTDLHLALDNSQLLRRDWQGLEKFDHGALTFPIRMEMELTALCNWNCGFCYNVWKIDNELTGQALRDYVKSLPNKNMNTALAKSMLDYMAERGTFIIRYSGGETMLHPDFWEIIEHGAGHNFYQVVFTNGHFVTRDAAMRLRENHVGTVLISLHGDRETHNQLTGNRLAYDKALTAIRNLKDAGVEVVVEATLVQANHDRILDEFESIRSLGVTEFRLMRYVPTGKNDTSYAVTKDKLPNIMLDIEHRQRFGLLNETHFGWPCGQTFCHSDTDAPISSDDPLNLTRLEQLEGHCGAGRVWASISYDGRLRNCPHSNVYFTSGSATDLAAGWRTLSQAVAEATSPRTTCSGCTFTNSCKGGCHLSHFIKHVA